MKVRLTLLMVIMMLLATIVFADNFSQDINKTNGNPSPVDLITRSSVNQFTAGETNSRIDDYINQDEQIYLDKDSGVVKVLRVNQKDLVNDYVTALIQFKNIHPRELRGVVRDICGLEGGNADVFQDKVAGQYYLQVVCPKFQLPYIVDALSQLDQPGISETSDGSALLYYKAKFRRAIDLINATTVYATPKTLKTPDIDNNAVQVSDQPCGIPLIQLGFTHADIPPSQIAIDAKIYEVDISNDAKLGVDFVAWKNGPGRTLFETIISNSHTHESIKTDFDINNVDISDIFHSKAHEHWKYTSYNALATSAFVDFLQSKGKAKLVTKSCLTTKSGNFTEIASVDQVLAFDARYNPNNTTYKTLIYSLDEGGDEAEVITTVPDLHARTLNYRNSGSVGVYVGLLPFVGLETTELGVTVHISDVSDYTNKGAPIINHRFVDSYVRLKDGEPFVLGGLKRQHTVKNVNKVPFLGSLPVLGWLFGGETMSKGETMIVVTLVPHTSTSTESKLEMPEEYKTIIAQVEGSQPLPLPENCFGFDQWLLDKEK